MLQDPLNNLKCQPTVSSPAARARATNIDFYMLKYYNDCPRANDMLRAFPPQAGDLPVLPIIFYSPFCLPTPEKGSAKKPIRRRAQGRNFNHKYLLLPSKYHLKKLNV